jgi:hypothetical protein
VPGNQRKLLSTAASTGVTRLAFANGDGSAIPVANQLKPITFTLPSVDDAAAGSRRPVLAAGQEQAACQFWSPADGAYKQQGCIGVPNPAPPNATLSFIPEYLTPDDTSLIAAWQIEGPIADGCCSFLLNCSDPAHANMTVPLDPYRPLSQPVVRCSDLTAPSVFSGTFALRLFTGSDCALWNPNNTYGCWWDATKQTFAGDGCVSQGPTRCMCRHLTDFASTRKPTIKTASLSDMTALSPGDLITKLKFLFVTVMVLFGGMCCGAIMGAVLDRNERKSLLTRLQQAECGFRSGPGGSWLWRLEQDPLGAELGKPHGTAMQLSAVFGMPFMRLRLALPEAMLPGAIAEAIGRRAGLSPSEFKAGFDEEHVAMKRIVAGLKKSFGIKPRAGRIPRTSSLTMDDDLDPVLQRLKSMEDGARAVPGHKQQLETSDVVGTALAFAFMATCSVLPAPDLAAARAKAGHVLRHTPTGSERLDFDGLCDHFCVMLTCACPRLRPAFVCSPAPAIPSAFAAGNLNTREEWLKRARIWRLILAQSADGSFAPSACVAFSLLACDPEELQRAKSLPRRKYPLLGRIADLLDSDEEDAESEEETAAEDDLDTVETETDSPSKRVSPSELRLRNRILPRAFQRWRGMAEVSRNTDLNARGFLLPAEAPRDCLLTTSASTLLLCLPRELRLLRVAEARRQRELEAEKLKPRVKPPKPKPPSTLAGFGNKLATMNSELMAVAPPPQPDGLLAEAPTRRSRSKLELLAAVTSADTTAPPSLGEQLQALTHGMHVDEEQPPDAPDALRAATPSSSGNGVSDSEHDEPDAEPPPPLDVERVWVTLLVLSVLQRFGECALFSADDDPGERTIVDAGHLYLDAMAEHYPALAAALERGALQKRAKNTTARWQAVLGQRVAEVRAADALTSHMTLAHVQRTSAEVTRALVLRHETFSTLLAPAMDGLSRWQLFIILVTIVMSQLLVNIWVRARVHAPYPVGPACARAHLLPAQMFYSRGATCCDDVRLQMNCDPAGPCREFVGDCTDIPDQFTTMLFVDPLAECQPLPSAVNDYVCTAFPDEENPIDSFLVGLIALGVALPVTLFLQSAFALSNSVDSPDLWLDWPTSLWFVLVGTEGHKEWHYTRGGVLPSRLARWFARFYSQGEPTVVTLHNACIRLKCWLLCKPCPWEEQPADADVAEPEVTDAYELARAQDVPRSSSSRALLFRKLSRRLSMTAGYQDGLMAPETDEEKAARAEAQRDLATKRLLTSAGIIGTLITWALFSWFTLTYGLLIYSTLGAKAQDEFVSSWGISYGMGQASQWSDILSEVFKGLVVLAILERLQLTRHGSWLEQHLDFLSLQAQVSRRFSPCLLITSRASRTPGSY